MVGVGEEELYATAITKFGGHFQEDMIVEECAELIQAIQKYHRALRNNNAIAAAEAQQNVCEEIADVEIMLAQAHLLFPDVEIEQDRMIKLHRLAKERLGVKLDVPNLCDDCIYDKEWHGDSVHCRMVDDRKGFRRLDPITLHTYKCTVYE